MGWLLQSLLPTVQGPVPSSGDLSLTPVPTPQGATAHNCKNPIPQGALAISSPISGIWTLPHLGVTWSRLSQLLGGHPACLLTGSQLSGELVGQLWDSEPLLPSPRTSSLSPWHVPPPRKPPAALHICLSHFPVVSTAWQITCHTVTISVGPGRLALCQASSEPASRVWLDEARKMLKWAQTATSH